MKEEYQYNLKKENIFQLRMVEFVDLNILNIGYFYNITLKNYKNKTPISSFFFIYNLQTALLSIITIQNIEREREREGEGKSKK